MLFLLPHRRDLPVKSIGFETVLSAPRDAYVSTINGIEIDGLRGETTVTAQPVDCEVSVNGAIYVGPGNSVTVKNGDEVRLRLRTPGGAGITKTGKLYVHTLGVYHFAVTTSVAADVALAFQSLAAVGSISGGSSTLTLTSNPGFVIGDAIIVETTSGRG